MMHHPVMYNAASQTSLAEDHKCSNLQDIACQTGNDEDTSGQLAPKRLKVEVFCKFLLWY